MLKLNSELRLILHVRWYGYRLSCVRWVCFIFSMVTYSDNQAAMYFQRSCFSWEDQAHRARLSFGARHRPNQANRYFLSCFCSTAIKDLSTNLRSLIPFIITSCSQLIYMLQFKGESYSSCMNSFVIRIAFVFGFYFLFL